MKSILPLIACLLLAQASFSQCPPLILQCPGAPRTVCHLGTNDANFWNESYWWDPVYIHDLPEAPVDLTFQVADTCSTGVIAIRYLLFLDLDGDGAMETVVNSDKLPGFNTVYFKNANNPNYSGGIPHSFDERPVLYNAKYQFALEKTVGGDTITGRVRWNTIQSPKVYEIPKLPFGRHCVVWSVFFDGIEQTCRDTFTVQDCQKPSVSCLSGPTVNMSPTQAITFWATDLLGPVADNITPQALINTAIRKSGTGLGFPLRPDGAPQTSVTFGCNELGLQTLEIWARDGANNADFCETTVNITDSNLVCATPAAGNIPACFKSACKQEGMNDVSLLVTGLNPALPPVWLPVSATGPDDCFNLSAFPPDGEYAIAPIRDSDPLNGVSTFDLILINKHILGIEPLSTPYNMLAADANNSRSITTFDIVELRKLILGVYPKLPNNTSWRFVPKDFVFPNPYNAFQTPVPDSAAYMGEAMEFVGIKVGDVNCNAVASGFAPAAEDRSAAALTMPDIALDPGAVLDVPLGVPEGAEWLGFQFALQFDAEQVEVEAVMPGGLPGLDEQSYAQPEPGIVTASWFDATPCHIVPHMPLMTFRVRAKSAVRLSNAVRLWPQRLPAEAYSVDNRVQNLHLFFDDPVAAATAIVYAPQPNPTASNARIAVQLNQEESVRLELYDLTGRLLYLEERSQPAGLQWMEMPAAALARAGVYLWRVRAGLALRSGKLLRL